MTPLRRPGSWRFASALALSGLCAVAPAQAQDVELYDQPDFRGVRLTLSAAAPDLAAYGLGRVGSVVVRRGQWEFCTQPRFGGACITVGPGRFGQLPPALRGNLASLREGGPNPVAGLPNRPPPPAPERPGAAIVLFAGQFNGAQVALNEGSADLRARHFNDAVVSVEVRSGTWDLCSDVAFAGACLRVAPGRHVLPPGFSGQISSLRPALGLPTPVPPMPQPVPGGSPALVLFEHSGFGGRQLAFQGAQPRLDSVDFNDSASSVEIFRGRWQLCEHADYGGQCMVLGRGRHELAGLWQDSVSSLRPVFGIDDRPLPAGGGLTLFEHPDFSGRSLLRTELTLNLADLGYNDRASAVEVHGGRWELCSDAQFAGRCATFGPGLHQLPDFLNDRVSSTRPR